MTSAEVSDIAEFFAAASQDAADLAAAHPLSQSMGDEVEEARRDLAAGNTVDNAPPADLDALEQA